MPMSDAGRERLVHHYQVLAGLTEEQNAAIERRDLCERAAKINGNGNTARYYLEQVCEREARDGR